MLKEKLYEMKSNSEGIELFVIDDILDNGETDEEITDYIKKVIIHGCIEGAGPLMYYEESSKFFKDYYEEILDMVNDYYQENHSIPVDIFTAERLSWFSYETWVYRIARELGI